jgi:hypothetical protein
MPRGKLLFCESRRNFCIPWSLNPLYTAAAATVRVNYLLTHSHARIFYCAQTESNSKLRAIAPGR